MEPQQTQPSSYQPQPTPPPMPQPVPGAGMPTGTPPRSNKKMVVALAVIAAAVVIGLSAWALVVATQPKPATPAAETAETAPAVQAEAQVEITAGGFVPAELTIAPNTKVVWLNNTSAAVQLVADATELTDFGSDAAQPQDSYVYTFAKAGDYSYVSKANANMRGTIHVK